MVGDIVYVIDRRSGCQCQGYLSPVVVSDRLMPGCSDGERERERTKRMGYRASDLEWGDGRSGPESNCRPPLVLCGGEEQGRWVRVARGWMMLDERSVVKKGSDRV